MLTRFRNFLLSPTYLLFPLFIGLFGLLGDEKIKIASMIVNVFVITLILFLSDDLLPALLPALPQYRNYDILYPNIFVSLLPLKGVPP